RVCFGYRELPIYNRELQILQRDNRSPQKPASSITWVARGVRSTAACEMSPVISSRTGTRPRSSLARYSDSAAGMRLSSRPCSRKTGAEGFGDLEGDRGAAPPYNSTYGSTCEPRVETSLA